MIKLLGRFTIYTGGGSGADAPPMVLTDARIAYLTGEKELDFNSSQTHEFDFNKIIVDISLN